MFLRKTSGVNLGKVRGYLLKEEILTDLELNHHVHIVGASGFGKTNLISHIVRDQIFRNKGLLFVDLKNDIETVDKFKAFAQHSNRSHQLKTFSLTDIFSSTYYNPVKNGSATELRDRIMSSFTWSEEYYKNQTSSFLIRLLTALCFLRDVQHKSFDLHTIYRATHDYMFVEDLCLGIIRSLGRRHNMRDEFVRIFGNVMGDFSAETPGLKLQNSKNKDKLKACERAMCFRVGHHLAKRIEGSGSFSGYFVDLEYNLDLSKDAFKRSITDGNIYTDIIVHKRTKEKTENLAIIEVKFLSDEVGIDEMRKRVSGLREKYGYSVGGVLKLPESEGQVPEIEWLNIES